MNSKSKTKKERSYRIGELAKLAHVSVRTLHHYDELAILKPSFRSEAGYRSYSETDLDKLQNILFYKELGFSLDAIANLLANPQLDSKNMLCQQRDLIRGQILRFESMLSLIDKTLSSTEGELDMSTEEKFEVFGDFNPKDYENEVKERWGDTDAYKVSSKRTKSYSKADWQRYHEENTQINNNIATLIQENVSPSDPRAMDAVEEARLLIDRWFYPCSKEMHVNLGDMYVADPRFTATYEAIQEGMAKFMKDAIQANAQHN